MQNSKSSYKKFSQLSVSTGNIMTNDYERVCETEIGYKRVYETEIGYSMLLSITGFHRLSAQGDGQIFFPNSTHPTYSGRKSSEAHRH